tara:strand:- start:232 stop:462 length:231 start_codon:yes stop_codon:yes gene_type:complete
MVVVKRQHYDCQKGFATTLSRVERSMPISALPSDALVFVVAQQYETYVQRAAATIVISNSASIVNVTTLAIYFGIG